MASAGFGALNFWTSSARLFLVADTANNPTDTTYAIYESCATNSYLDVDGTLGHATPVQAVYSSWNNGGDGVWLTSLSGASLYCFKAEAFFPGYTEKFGVPAVYIPGDRRPTLPSTLALPVASTPKTSVTYSTTLDMVTLGAATAPSRRRLRTSRRQ